MTACMTAVTAYLEEDGVPAEELELVHLGHGERHHGVVVIDRVLHDQPVGPLLLIQDRRGKLITEEKHRLDKTKDVILLQKVTKLYETSTLGHSRKRK